MQKLVFDAGQGLFQMDLAPGRGLAGDLHDLLDVVVRGQFLAFERDQEGVEDPHEILICNLLLGFVYVLFMAELGIESLDSYRGTLQAG